MALEFEWNPQKASANLRKHGVSFEEASSVFGDPSAAIVLDEDHSISELRELLIGHSDRSRLLIVAFTERDGRIRIISARRTTAFERETYEEKWAQ